MKVNPLELQTGVDRLATNDEIRAAISFLPGCIFIDAGESEPSLAESWEHEEAGETETNVDDLSILRLLGQVDDTVN